LSVNGQAVGGAAVLSGYFQADRAASPNTLTVTAGDEFGATPPLSSFFGDIPAVKALNLMGLSADTFGNHNFDRGTASLQSLIDMASYKFVSSNLDALGDNLKGVEAPFYLVSVGQVKVGLVGITNPDVPQLTAPANLGTLAVSEPVAAATLAAQEARAGGADLVVVLAHLGATAKTAAGNPTGPLIDFANLVTGVDLILGDHTDFAVNVVINNVHVVENRSFGATYARVNLTFDPMARTVTNTTVDIVTPLQCQPMPGIDGGTCVPAIVPDPAVVSMLNDYRGQLGAVLDAKVAVANGLFDRGNNIERLSEVPIGDLLTDAFRSKYGSQLAIMNGGGIRAPLPSTYQPKDTSLRRTSPGYAAGPPYDLVAGDAIAVLPFGNSVVTRMVTGGQLWAALEHSVSMQPAAFGGFLQISGFKYTFKLSNPVGSRVVSVALSDGTAIANDATSYTMALGDFTNGGGDGYTMLADGTGTTRDKMDAVLLDYLKANTPLTPATSNRITSMP
jgi:5'-nucleotidase